MTFCERRMDEPDAMIVDHVARLAGPVLEWLADRHGLNFSVIEDFSYPGIRRAACMGSPRGPARN